MATNTELRICDIDESLYPLFKKFRFRKEKTVAAIVMKIVPEGLKVVLDEEYEDISIEDLVAELPDHLPRYILLSYILKHDDGRISFPMIFLFVSPTGVKPEMQMMYAGSKLTVVQASNATKVFELRDLDELTDEYLNNKLSFFG